MNNKTDFAPAQTAPPASKEKGTRYGHGHKDVSASVISFLIPMPSEWTKVPTYQVRIS